MKPAIKEIFIIVSLMFAGTLVADNWEDPRIRKLQAIGEKARIDEINRLRLQGE